MIYFVLLFLSLNNYLHTGKMKKQKKKKNTKINAYLKTLFFFKKKKSFLFFHF